MYPKIVKAKDVVNNGLFAPGLYRIKGGRAFYDEVWMADGGIAVYPIRIEVIDNDDGGSFKIIKRHIDWDTELEQMFGMSDR
jgi:hypothetical protein